MLNPRSVQCLRLIAPSLPSLTASSSSSLSRNRKLCHPNLTTILSRNLTVSRSQFGQEAHGVTQEASLPPGSTKDAGKIPPVPEAEREALPSSASPLDVYNWRVRYHDLTTDPHQQEVTEHLLKLYNKLHLFRPSSPSFFSNLLPGPTSRRWGLGPAAKVPRGVYIWGTVGGGKTMLMDMFYDTLPGISEDVKCKRVHYHDFMQVSRDNCVVWCGVIVGCFNKLNNARMSTDGFTKPRNPPHRATSAGGTPTSHSTPSRLWETPSSRRAGSSVWTSFRWATCSYGVFPPSSISPPSR